MPVVTGSIVDPASGAFGGSCEITLVDDTGAPLLSASVGGASIASFHTPAVSPTTGAWSATLPANSTITPAGTKYRVIGRRLKQKVVDRYIEVPSGAGPYADTGPGGIESDAPAALSTSAITALRTALVPVVTQGIDAVYNTVNTTGAWADVDTAGTADARPMDLIIPDAFVGGWVRVSLSSQWTNLGASAAYLDMWTIVDGLPVRSFMGAANNGVSAWAAAPSVYSIISGLASYQLQTGDIDDDGFARLRLRYKATGARTMIGNFVGSKLQLEGTGPF